MIEALRRRLPFRRLPFARREIQLSQPEKVPSGAFCVSPEQLAQSNLKESSFDSYRISIVDKQNGLAVELSVYKNQEIHGLPFHLPPNLSAISIGVHRERLRRATQQTILDLAETAMRLCELANGQWVQSEANLHGTRVSILLPGSTNSPDGLWTQGDVGSFIEKLPNLGFQYEPDAGRAHYDGDLTRDEVEKCNFPSEAKARYLSILTYLDPKFWGFDKV